MRNTGFVSLVNIGGLSWPGARKTGSGPLIEEQMSLWERAGGSFTISLQVQSIIYQSIIELGRNNNESKRAKCYRQSEKSARLKSSDSSRHVFQKAIKSDNATGAQALFSSPRRD
jgi:hypothetical protein